MTALDSSIRPNSRAPALVRNAGEGGRRLLESVGSLSALMLDSVWATGEGVFQRRFSWREFVDQAWFLISVSFLPALLIAFPFGVVIVIEVGSVATTIGATSFVGAVDAVATVREAAPIITALVLAGAGGSAICSDLGSRTIRDEIAALNVMGIDPVGRLVSPRVLATVVVSLLLNGIVAFVGIVSGYLAAVVMLHQSAGGFLNSFSAFSQPADLIESMLKAAVFGLIAVSVAAHKGMTVKRGPRGSAKR